MQRTVQAILATFLLIAGTCGPMVTKAQNYVAEPASVVAGNDALKISYSEFSRLVDEGAVSTVTISTFERSLRGVRKDGTEFSVILSPQLALADRLVAAGVETQFADLYATGAGPAESGFIFITYLFEFLPWVILGIFFVWLIVFSILARRKAEQRVDRHNALMEENNKQLAEILRRLSEASHG